MDLILCFHELQDFMQFLCNLATTFMDVIINVDDLHFSQK